MKTIIHIVQGYDSLKLNNQSFSVLTTAEFYPSQTDTDKRGTRIYAKEIHK